jgi:4-amino-4-deoxy-L-arabinose transferase-like glycosyltransferase
MPFVVLLGSLALSGLGIALFRRWLAGFDPMARLGLGGLLGLGVLGTYTLLVGLLPGGLDWGGFGVIVLALVGIWFLIQEFRGLTFAKPENVDLLAYLALAVGFLFALCAVLTPSTPNDWDSIAYHLAIPKIYLANGQIRPILFIHHSNFPAVVDLSFVWGLLVGGQAGAKAFILAYTVFGVLAIGGIAKEAYGKAASLWAMVAFATVPVVLWESGTAYIDVAHGLFAGFGLLLALKGLKDEHRASFVLAGLMLGLACASKYTGLQTLFVAALILGISLLLKRQSVRPVFTVVLIAVVVASPWYVKNVVWTGNPTYPFFYEVFHGQNWDQRRADIYAVEQKSFGVGLTTEKREWGKLGHAVLGLAYQPGRYINPMQTEGGGSPLGAIGLAVFGGLLFWSLAIKPKPFEAALLGAAGLSLILWFALSQQSRYITTLAVPACILAGGAAVDRRLAGRVVAGLIAIQAGITLYVNKQFVFDTSSQVALHKVDETEFLKASLGSYYGAVEKINALPAGSKVALYDQVFGFYLDTPYFWANPPHCTVIPYDQMKSGNDYVAAMSKLGFTHIYVQFVDPKTDGEFAKALGLNGIPEPLSAGLRDQWQHDWIQVWKVWLCDAVASGAIKPVAGFNKGLLLQLPVHFAS